MKISVSWLRELVPVDWPAERLAAELTRIGLPVEGIERRGADLTGFVVGHVLRAERHPNADRLTLCSVDVGQAEPLDIVCGAPNARAGMRVAVALVGATLPDGTRIRRAKIRGVESNGMMCSERELGLSGEHAGIIELKGNPAPGAPLADSLQVGDVLLDVDVPSNRGDCFSHLGVARELAALVGVPPALPDARVPEDPESAGRAAAVAVEDPEGCPLYVARIIRDVKVGPSPDWLVRKLAAIGQRSINNVVDVTNLVLWETGQPIHAFDLDRLEGRRIVVRRARPGEKLVTLDGVERTLTPEVLVIADEGRAVALAGIMGGGDSEVTLSTTSILLESAWFDPFRVLRGTAVCRLTTEASLRFVRGVDPAGVARAADRCAALLAGEASGRVLKGRLDVTRSGFLDPRHVELRPGAVEKLLGEAVSDEESAAILTRLGFAPAGGRRFSVPSHRLDVTLECDLVEEVARFHGYDRLGERDYNVSGLSAARSAYDRGVERIRQAWLGLGFNEILTKALVDSGQLHRPESTSREGEGADMREGATMVKGAAILIPAPQSEDESMLRTSLLPGALKAIRLNLHHGARDIRLFEIGPVFRKDPDSDLSREPVEIVAAAVGGEFGPDLTRSDPRMDYARFKGAVEAFLKAVRVDTPEVRCYDENGFEPRTSMVVESRGRPIGVMGRVASSVCEPLDISRPVFACRFILADVLDSTVRVARFEEPSRYPASRRDLAFLVDQNIPEARVSGLIRSLGGPLLKSVVLFDRFTGTPDRPLPGGKVNLAYTLTWQAEVETLSDEKVRGAERRVVLGLEKELGAVLRDR